MLLHICCGPCATAIIKKLQEDGYEVIGYYDNPNIHPSFEYKKRLLEAKKLANDTEIRLIVEEYNPIEYFKAIRGSEESQKERCVSCWSLRLEKAAKKAKELGLDIFGTTLRISPYQNQEALLALAKKIAKKEGIFFYETDLLGCFGESVTLSKKRGMYRQKYCGCIFSKEYR
jgi:epoxyqueuosine reductase